MGFKPTGVDDRDPIPKGYYDGVFERMESYDSEDKGRRLNIFFRVEHDGEEVEIPYNVSNILSMYDNEQSSKLGKLFEKFGLEQVVDDAMNAGGDLKDGNRKFVSEDEEDDDRLRTALKAALAGKKFELNVTVDDGSNWIEKVTEMERLQTEENSQEDPEEE